MAAVCIAPSGGPPGHGSAVKGAYRVSRRFPPALGGSHRSVSRRGSAAMSSGRWRGSRRTSHAEHVCADSSHDMFVIGSACVSCRMMRNGCRFVGQPVGWASALDPCALSMARCTIEARCARHAAIAARSPLRWAGHASRVLGSSSRPKVQGRPTVGGSD